jgi:hypothetical protein
MASLASRRLETPVGSAPVIPVIVMIAGGYLCWFAVHYWRSDTKYPTDPLKAVLTGKPIPTPDRSAVSQALQAIADQVGTAAASGGAAGGATAPGTLSYAQLTRLWVSNGGDSRTANVAAAVALAESSGRTGVTSPNPDGGTNVGLWQLDTKGVGAGHTVAELQNPDTNARITVMGSANGSNWSHWEAYTSGRYKQFLKSGPVATS